MFQVTRTGSRSPSKSQSTSSSVMHFLLWSAAAVTTVCVAAFARPPRSIDGDGTNRTVAAGANGSAADPALRRTVPRLAASDTLPSARWLSLLPDGEKKRRFILDCTGCHQFSGQVARARGQVRSVEDWEAAIGRMLQYAGASTNFPVISGGRAPRATAEWLVRHLNARPRPERTRVRRGEGEVTEYAIPAPQDLPHDLALDSTGRVVVTGMMTHRMYVLDPSSARFDILPIPVEGANPRAVEIDSVGNWWVVLGTPKMLARYSPESRQWKTFDVGVYPHSLALDASGGVWYNGHFTRDPEVVGRVDAETGRVKTFSVPRHPNLGTRPGGPIPYEIRVAPDGRVWGSELLGNRIYGLSPANGRFHAFAMPVTHSGPRRFDIDNRGSLWIPAYAINELIRFDPASERFRRFKLPIEDAVPYVVRIDHATGDVWVGTSAADAVLRFDRVRESFSVYELPSRGALVRHLAVDQRSHDVWIAYGASPSPLPAKIARIQPR
jgi:virginiamycin B lyase